MDNIKWIIGFLGSAALAVVTTIVGRWAYDHLTTRLLVRRITSSGDEDLDALFALHTALFPDEDIASSPDDLRRWLDECEELEESGQCLLEEYLFVAKRLGKVVGYLYATFYRDSGYVFISYYGIDSSDAVARSSGARKLMGRIFHTIRKRYPDWNGIIAELQMGDAPKLRRRFSAYARGMGLTGYEINIDYLQPPITPDPSKREVREVLVFIPSRKITPIEGKYLLKPVVLSVLRFVYLQVYGDSFTHDHELDRLYRTKLLQLYGNFEQALPRCVEISPLGQRRRGLTPDTPVSPGDVRASSHP